MALINTVTKNHLYMEQSLQTSYTAALYFLFQNAVRRQALNALTASGSAASPQLEFTGSLKRMNVLVSIPTTNVVVSLVGCFLLSVISVGVVCLAKRSEHVTQQSVSAEIVAEAMMNSSKYPPWLLKLALEKTAAEKNIRCPLQDLRIQSVLLRHNEDDKIVFHVGSGM